MTTRTVVTLELPQPSRLLHPNGRPKNHFARSKLVRSYRKTVYDEVLVQLGVPGLRKPLPAPVTAQVVFTFGVERDRDEDGAGAWLKAMWDGLVDAKVLTKDDSEHLHLLPVVFEVVPKAKPSLKVTLEAGE